MKENLKRIIKKGVVAGAMTLGLSGQAEARETAKDTISFAGEARAGQSQSSQEAFEKARADYLSGKWVDASVVLSEPLEENEEAQYINQKYFLKIMKPEFHLGKGVVVSADSTQGFITVNKTSGKLVYLDMLEAGNPAKSTNGAAFQALVKDVLEKEGLPASVSELFRGLLISPNK